MDLSTFTTLSFDCYGTLIDWETGILESLGGWRRRHRLDVSDEDLLELYGEAEIAEEQTHPGALYPDILKAVLRRIGLELDVEVDDAEADAFSRSVPSWPSFADSPQALAYLKDHFRLAILSNVDRKSFAGSNRRLGVSFDLIVTAEDVGSYKPDPRNFRRLLSELHAMGVTRSQVLHVAQSLRHDIEPANQLGLATVWVDRRHGKRGCGATVPPTGDPRPDMTVTSLAEFAGRHRTARGS
jgi:2-haloalkanoic acid dehalogenase type II